MSGRPAGSRRFPIEPSRRVRALGVMTSDRARCRNHAATPQSWPPSTIGRRARRARPLAVRRRREERTCQHRRASRRPHRPTPRSASRSAIVTGAPRGGARRDQARDRRPGRDARARPRLPRRRWPPADRGRAGAREDPHDQDDGGGPRRLVQADPVHTGPRPVGPRRARASTGRTRAASRPTWARCSATSSSPTRSIAPPRRCSPRSSR